AGAPGRRGRRGPPHGLRGLRRVRAHPGEDPLEDVVLLVGEGDDEVLDGLEHGCPLRSWKFGGRAQVIAATLQTSHYRSSGGPKPGQPPTCRPVNARLSPTARPVAACPGSACSGGFSSGENWNTSTNTTVTAA